MQRIRIDTTNCRDATGFYTVLLQALRAPAWHGHNMDALWDSLVGGDVIGAGPPLMIEIDMPPGTPTKVRRLADRFAALCLEARSAQGVEVSVRIASVPEGPAQGPG
jgi:RNAse (barnase) inhibitor barstar